MGFLQGIISNRNHERSRSVAALLSGGIVSPGGEMPRAEGGLPPLTGETVARDSRRLRTTEGKTSPLFGGIVSPVGEMPKAEGGLSPLTGETVARDSRRLSATEGLKYNLYLCLAILLIGNSVFSQEKKKERKNFTRVVAGPVLSFYQNNPFHTSDSKPRYAFFIAAYEDIKIYNDFTFMTGIEYARHGLSFNSYYLAPGHQYLYDKNFDYNYRLTLQEVRLNFLLKDVIGIETRNLITGYTSCGYVMRYVFDPDLHVSSNLTGAELFNGEPNISFEHDLFRKNISSAVKFIAGAQRNFFKTHRAFFFEASFTFALSRFQLKHSFTPSSLYINGSFLQLGFGIKV